ncbi:non-ribosomal peptide synthetase [Streptosporangium saharense]|uniref:Amino acid adenylation domain-containing protein n=1 Tax=Streptosporangium saharense TaxID=1706840 RepID=A0A7W7QI58_9ACTN|nr:non-ribosomal peptide synthetase [Streptosporangium saharense]MBB4913541.1 amino acid adenylation domain-containing protein [Streptosporangium saharense]
MSALRDVLPLTPLQEGILFHAQSGHDPYLVQVTLDLEGALDVARLCAAGDALLARHPNLRAAFLTRASGQAVQVVPDAVRLPLRVHDLTGGDRAAFERIAAADLAEPFDLTAAPAMRLTLLTTGHARHRLLLTYHHVLLDGWSNSLLVGDLLRLYAAEGDASALPGAPPYRNFLAWLRERERDGRTLDVWRRRLAGLDEPTLVATHADSQVGRPVRAVAELPAGTSAALAALCRKTGVTLSTVLQAAWALLLRGLTDRHDVTFGLTVSGRDADVPGIESMVGLFVNTVPARVTLDPAEALPELLRRIRDAHAETLGAQHVGLAAVQRAVGTRELFDTLVVVESHPVDPGLLGGDFGGLRLRAVRGSDATGYPLALVAVPGRRLKLNVDHQPGLVAPEVAGRLHLRLAGLLAMMAGNPGVRTADLPVTLPGEQEPGWNATATPVPGLDVVEMFREQVSRHPGRVAVSDEGESLTYAELDRWADHLAGELSRYGAAPERLVGVACERSTGLVAALLAVLKTGAAYVPLDTDHPRDRLRAVLDDTDPVCVLADATWTHDTGRPVLRIDRPEEGETPRRHGGGHHRDRTAYVLHTSGSTGRPKGVAVTHRALANRLRWTQHRYPLTEDDRVLQKTPVSFDVSGWEFFWPLTRGAELVMARPGGHRDPAYLASVIAGRRVTVAHFVPAMLREFVEDPAVPAVHHLRRIICSGEALPSALVALTQARLGAVAVENLYGPTEAAIDVTSMPCDPAVLAEAAVVPIGRPVWNTVAYVLDSWLRLAPVGVAGELYVGGVQLARGYHGRPGLTAERFVASPFAPGERLYRTGDLVRRRADGVLEFLGRTDQQVKIRGVRVEPGEIEAALLTHPGVRGCAVRTLLHPGGGAYLAAYVVGGTSVGGVSEAGAFGDGDSENGASGSGAFGDGVFGGRVSVGEAFEGGAPGGGASAGWVSGSGAFGGGASGGEIDVAELREYLARLLPPAMVPSAYVPLDALPLTASGKVDLGALPVPDTTSTRVRREPSGRGEERLCALFGEVLGLSGEAGADDDFFELGGDSILAMRLAGRGRREGLDLTVVDVFEHRTPAALAAAVPEIDSGTVSEGAVMSGAGALSGEPAASAGGRETASAQVFPLASPQGSSPALPQAPSGTSFSGVPASGALVSGEPVPGALASEAPVLGASSPGAPVSGAPTSGVFPPGTLVSGTSASGVPTAEASVSEAPASGAPTSAVSSLGAPTAEASVSEAYVPGVPSPGVPASGAPAQVRAVALPLAAHRLRRSGLPPATYLFTAVHTLGTRFEPGALSEAVEAVARRHDALRLRVTTPVRRPWKAGITAPGQATIPLTHGNPADDLSGHLRRARAEVDLEAGRPFHVVAVTDEEGTRLVAAAHGAALDDHSLHRVLAELAGTVQNGTVEHPPEAGEDALGRWLDLLAGGTAKVFGPWKPGPGDRLRLSLPVAGPPSWPSLLAAVAHVPGSPPPLADLEIPSLAGVGALTRTFPIRADGASHGGDPSSYEALSLLDPRGAAALRAHPSRQILLRHRPGDPAEEYGPADPTEQHHPLVISYAENTGRLWLACDDAVLNRDGAAELLARLGDHTHA